MTKVFYIFLTKLHEASIWLNIFHNPEIPDKIYASVKGFILKSTLNIQMYISKVIALAMRPDYSTA